MIVSVKHDQREKPNNLKLVQRTKVLIHNQLADKAKARLPTFLHNLHLVVCYIFLILNNIHQITTCRLFDSIQFCVVTFFVTHRIFLWAPLLFMLIVISQNVILSGKPRLPPDKLFKMNNLSVETYHLTDKLHFESQLFQELVLCNRDHKKTWTSNEQESLFCCSLYA